MTHRLFKLALLVSAISLMLAGCQTTPVIGPDAEFFDPDRCVGWPKKSDGLSEPEYVLRGYQSYRCERDSRLAAGEALKRLER